MSPAVGGVSYGGGSWSIAHLNHGIHNRWREVWPRMDKIPGCPGEVAALVARVLVGT